MNPEQRANLTEAFQQTRFPYARPILIIILASVLRSSGRRRQAVVTQSFSSRFGLESEVSTSDGPLPGVAPVAKQQGAYVARVITSRLAGKSPPPPFRYRNVGNLATIGRKEAVVDFGWLRLTGRIAWLVWGIAHIYFLIGFRNRIAVAIDWLWSYLT